jgi:hypothetical protein
MVLMPHARHAAPIRAAGAKWAYEPDPVTTRAAGLELTVLAARHENLVSCSSAARPLWAGLPRRLPWDYRE